MGSYVPIVYISPICCVVRLCVCRVCFAVASAWTADSACLQRTKRRGGGGRGGQNRTRARPGWMVGRSVFRMVFLQKCCCCPSRTLERGIYGGDITYAVAIVHCISPVLRCAVPGPTDAQKLLKPNDSLFVQRRSRAFTAPHTQTSTAHARDSVVCASMDLCATGMDTFSSSCSACAWGFLGVVFVSVGVGRAV